MNAAIMAIVAVGVALAGVILTSVSSPRLVLDECHRMTRGVCRT